MVASFFPFLSILSGRGFDAGEIGAILAAMAVVRMISMPIWGHVARAHGAAPRAATGLLGMVVFAVVASVLDSLLGVAFGAVGVARCPPPDQHRRARPSWSSARSAWRTTAGSSVERPRATACRRRRDPPSTASVSRSRSTPPRAVALVWTTIAVRDRPEHREDHGRLGSVGAVFRAAPLLGLLLATLLVWTGFNGAWNFVGLKIRDPLLIGLGTALGGFTEVGVMQLVPPASAAAGSEKVYALGCFVYATGFFLWGVVANRTIVSLLAVFEGAGFSLLFTVDPGRGLLRPRCTRAATRSARCRFGIGPILGAGSAASSSTSWVR